MDEFNSHVGTIITISGAAVSAVVWVVREIRASRRETTGAIDELASKVSKMDKHKISYKEHERRMAAHVELYHNQRRKK